MIKINMPFISSSRYLLCAAAALAGLGVAALGYSLTLPHPSAAPPDLAASRSTSSPPGDSASSQGLAASTAPAPATSTTAPIATASPEPAQVDGGSSSAALQRALNSSSPPDLPSATANALIALGRRDLTRDLVAGGTAAGLQIQAAIARRHAGRTDLADVTLLYTDKDPATLEPEHLAVLAFALTPSGWVPVVGQSGASEP